ncbi:MULTISPECIES: aminotransferase class V-fold PLP-dependent enzyme [unclassified Rathayibacter]|uniref:aminotransferase class V-fold PLP-dependent enzyme n=1 Tax=unclassified Rathayibacter TaxID=2609250 RepID=UPI001FB42ACF|nr:MULTISPECIES: aminotransferase class V-fold PLP-dependent enzyme [unclassified Rathayibacter]MCJ1673783.1 aminotransferase class V-fold PLP-dependent enzyme [Rathayibacter sp. VKM Ac-2929]MCJ1683219.1 aminotransferase class V-fold PLP-dependent enzyme [Rathayibacter sp. VKM Ac-2928]
MTIGLTGGAPARTSIDVAAERARTAGTAGRHYFNAAGAGLMTDSVLETVIAHLRLEQRIGGYEAANHVADRVDAAYAAAAALLGADADEIAFFDSATSGLRAIFDALRLGPGDTVLAPRSSYVSQALRLLALERYDGVRLTLLPNDSSGGLDIEALESALATASGRTVISAVHVPTSSGLVEPVAAIGALARRYGAITVLDATQSVGQLDIDVRAIDCDALVTTGRKFLRGPRGTGLVFLRRGLLEGIGAWAPDVRGSQWTSEQEWTMDGTARALETWESSVALRLGLGEALREAHERGTAATEAHLVALGARLRTELSAIGGVTVADPPVSPSGIVTFTVDGVPGKTVSARLREAAVDSLAVPASHAQWDLGARGLASVVRVSPHVYTDESDVEALLTAVAGVSS